MKYAAAIAHFRQLCCLNLHPQMLMPSLLNALHGLIGSDSNAFYWSAQPGRITNVYMEEPMPADISALYYDEFLNNTKRPDAALGIRKVMKPGQLVGNSANLFARSFFDTDKYNLIWRPLSRKWLLWAVLHDQSGGTHGITFRRLNGESPFSQRDEQRVTQLLPYLRHAINATVQPPDGFVDHGESGLIVMDQNGTLRYQSADGRRLMLLATHATISSGTVAWRRLTFLPMLLGRLCQRMSAISSGQNAAPPVEIVENAWGRFVLRAHQLDGTDDAVSLVGITIQRQVPIALSLMTNMRALDLSSRQTEVCLQLAQGKSHSAIGTQLNISATTVVDHINKVYDKLGVRSRQALLARLSNARL